MATSTVYKGKTREDTLTLLVDEDGNVISSSNPLPTNAIVSVDTMSLTAEMKVDSGHDLYLAQNVTRFDDSKVTFDSISGLSLLEIQSVENKTKGWVYSTKGAVVTATSLEIIPANQSAGYPVIATGDIIEIAYRGTSRFDALANDSTLTDKSQITQISDGTNEIDVINNADAWEPGTTDLKGFGVYGYDSSANVAKPLKLNASGELMVDAEITNEEMKVGSEDDTSGNAHFLKTDSAGALLDVEVIQATAADLNMTEANSGDIKTALELLDDSVYTDGTGTPSKGLAIMGSDGTNPQLISVDTDGKLNIGDISSGTQTNDIKVTLDSEQVDIGDISAGTQTNDIKVTLDSEAVEVVQSTAADLNMTEANSGDILSTLTDKSQFTKIHSPIKAVANLVTAENLTGAYADLGSEIDTEGYSKIGIWVKAEVNDSETVSMKVVGLHTTSGDEYELDAVSEKTLWTTGASDFNKYYEFEIGAVSLLKIQAKAGTVGSTAGTLTVDITKVN